MEFKRGFCANNACFIHGKKRKLCRKLCSIPECNDFLCDDPDCHKVHAQESHPDRRLEDVKAVTRSEKQGMAMEIPEVFDTYRGHQKCSVCLVKRSYRR